MNSLLIKKTSLLIYISIIMTNKYNEPSFELIQKSENIEIRQYGENIIAKTSLKNADINQNSSMFRTLADYIFGNNIQSKKIPMTTPVMTRYDNRSYDMIFFMLDIKEIKDLPEPVNQDVVIEKVSLNKVVVIQFSWWASEKNITKHESILREYIIENNLEITSSLMVAQYDPPFTLPNFRRNELMYQIK